MIELSGVTKIYRPLLGRPVRAVTDFSLRIDPGEVLGLAGPNGAGKSTLIALLLGYLRPSVGRIAIDGHAPRHYIERNGVGYMAELVAMPPTWTLEGALVRYGLLAGLGDRALRERVRAVIAKLGLEEHRAKRVRQLSKGNLQRLGLAQVLLREERVVILDEPTHGLDPVWTQHFRELVRELRAPARVILIASHNLDELERVADRVVIIDRGRLQRIVTMRGGGAPSSATYRMVLDSGAAAVPDTFPGAREIAAGEFEVRVDSLAALNAALAALLARGALVRSVTPAYSSLERQFREAIGEDSA